MTYSGKEEKMAKQEEIFDPNAEPVPDKDKQVSTDQPQETPDWFYSDKFNSIEDQAKAYKPAVQEMKAKEQETAELRRRNEELETIVDTTGAKEPIKTEDEYEEDEKVALERKYGMPFNEIKARYDITNLVVSKHLKPILDNVYQSQYQQTKSVMSSKPFFKDYEEEIDKRLSKVPLEERVKTSKVNDVYNQILVENLPNLLERAKSGGEPAQIPSVNTSGASPEVKPTKSVLTEDQLAYLKRVGANIDNVEKAAKGEVERKEWTGIVG